MSLQILRGTSANRTSVTPDLGEPLYTTDDQKLYIGDGTTAGGNQISGGLDADMTRTSASSLTIGTGTKTFNFSALSNNLGWLPGTRIRASATGGDYMEGEITTVTSSAVTIDVDYTVGSGSHSSWNLTIAGDVGATGATGAAGADGANGTDGDRGGVLLTFDTTTTDADPGAGKFRVNNATIASASFLYVDNTDTSTNDITSWLDSFDDSTNTVKGHIVIHSNTVGDATLMIFRVTGTVVDGTGYRKIPVAYVSGALPSNNEVCAINFSRAGDAGSGASLTVINPSQITAWQNNYSPTSFGPRVSIRVDADTSFPFITGFSNSGFSDGDQFELVNDGTTCIGIKGNSTSSSAGNRVLSDDLVIMPGRTGVFEFDSTGNGFRPVNYNAISLETCAMQSRYGAFYRDECTSQNNYGPFGWYGSGSGSGATIYNGFNGPVGVMQLSTGTATTTRGYLYGTDPSSGNVAVRMASGSIYFCEFKVRLEDLSDGTNTFWFGCGFIDFSYLSSLPSDGVWLQYKHDVNSGNWQLSSTSGGTQTTTNSSTAVAADAWTTIRVVVYKSDLAEIFVNRTSVGTLTSNLPFNRDTNLCMIIEKTAGTTARLVYVDSYAIGAIVQ